MTTNDTQRGADGAGLRVTSDQVDDVLSNDLIYSPTIYAICRDWLDMQAERGRMLAVIEATRVAARDFPLIAYGDDEVMMACAHCMERWVDVVYGEGLIDVPHADDCPAVALIAALASLTPARDETAVGN